MALVEAVRARPDARLLLPEEIVAAAPLEALKARNPFEMQVTLMHKGRQHHLGLVPDFAFSLQVSGGALRNFLVEIDRGTMPVARRDITQSSFERKMRSYLAANAAKLHQRKFGWKGFRVLAVTSDARRMQTIKNELRNIPVAGDAGAGLFLFATRHEYVNSNALAMAWQDANGRSVQLI